MWFSGMFTICFECRYMCVSGLRGAVAFALALHMNFAKVETKRIILTATLSIVLFTLTILGGATMPVLKLLDEYWPDDEPTANTSSTGRRISRRRRMHSDEHRRSILLSKTQEMVLFTIVLTQLILQNPVIDTDDFSYSDYTETDDNIPSSSSSNRQTETIGAANKIVPSNGLARFDARYLRPLFVRKFSIQVKSCITIIIDDKYRI